MDLDRKGAQEAFQRFVAKHKDGISISLSNERIGVSTFSSERIISGGVLRGTDHPFEPGFVSPIDCGEELLAEFEGLLQHDSNESQLEEFLAAHYKDIFGPQYNRIETQLWLRFRDLDIADRSRRLDIFLKNSVINDWELYEVKRLIPLTGTYRDVPVISKEVAYALQQTKNYLRILSQDVVKRKLAQQGIEYFEPTLNLVVGKSPQISHAQWRWLVTSNSGGVKIITFDELLTEARERLRDRMRFLELSTFR
jgi:hypothetical protein